MDALDQTLALARTPGLHVGLLHDDPELLANPSRLLQASPTRLRALNVSAAGIAWLAHPDAALLAEDRRWVEAEGLRLLRWGDDDYPGRLAQIPDPPLVLFVRGPPAVLLHPQIAIVGSRRPTPSGRETARDFAAWLTRSGLLVTSGLARGIDGAAHEGALQVGRTVAIVATGLDRVYPPEHRALHQRIVDAGGAIVSEFPRGAPPLKEHFHQRNRLLSGLTLATLVVEAARQSGSLITAAHAARQGREVFAVPGSIHNVLSYGCHDLIRQGAQLVQSAQQLVEDLKIPVSNQLLDFDQVSPSGSVAGPDRLDNTYKILLDGLGFDSMGVDELVARTGLCSQTLAAMLLVLELSGVVAMHSGGRYQRVRKVAARA